MTTITYGVFATGGPISHQAGNCSPYAVYDDKEEAKRHAARLRKTLTIGERSYYKMSYVVKPIVPKSNRAMTSPDETTK